MRMVTATRLTRATFGTWGKFGLRKIQGFKGAVPDEVRGDVTTSIHHAGLR